MASDVKHPGDASAAASAVAVAASDAASSAAAAAALVLPRATLDAAVEYWRAVNVDATRATIDTQALAMTDSEEKSLEARRALAAVTKSRFRTVTRFRRRATPCLSRYRSPSLCHLPLQI